MATHSTIGYETPDGGYVGVRCHYDGYPSHVGRTLARMYHADVVIMVCKARAAGGLRDLNDDGTYQCFDGDTDITDIQYQWPGCEESWSYRKLLDGGVEFMEQGCLDVFLLSEVIEHDQHDGWPD